MPNFIASGIYFIFGTKFSWNERNDTCFDIECVLLGRNFVFLAGYLMVTARYLVVNAGYCTLRGGYLWLLLATGGYCLFPLLVCKAFVNFCFVKGALQNTNVFCREFPVGLSSYLFS